MSDSIISIDVGGQIIKTHISTLTKFPESMLATMFNHQDQGMAPMAKTDGVYFLDANPLHFRYRVYVCKHLYNTIISTYQIWDFFTKTWSFCTEFVFQPYILVRFVCFAFVCFERAIFQIFWKPHCCTKSLFVELETSN